MRAFLLSTAAAVVLAAATTWHKPPGPTPVVVELFTSQGCSSCPPADELIRDLARDRQLRGKVIPLAFHVDYWNRLGWRDPFSSPDWSRRQMFYARALHLDSAYTPQAVVNGSRQFVGSSVAAMHNAIDEASRRATSGTVRVEAVRSGDRIAVTVHGQTAPGSEIVLVLFDGEVTTRIGAGENSGRTQTESAIVRRLVSAGSGTVEKSVTFDVDPAWKELGVVALVQDRATLAITNAAVQYL